MTTKLLLWWTVLILQASKKPQNKTKTYMTSLSHALHLHIISLCTQFVDRALFHHALYASSRGSVLLACLHPQHPPPLTGQLPVMIQNLLNLKGGCRQICYFHKWGYWGFLQRFEPLETQPEKTVSQIQVVCCIKVTQTSETLSFTMVFDPGHLIQKF